MFQASDPGSLLQKGWVKGGFQLLFNDLTRTSFEAQLYAFMSRFEKDESNQITQFFSSHSQFVREALCQNFVIFKVIFLTLDKAPLRTAGHLEKLFLQAVTHLPSPCQIISVFNSIAQVCGKYLHFATQGL